MQNEIKLLKYRIETNYSKLIDKYGDKCELAIPVINMIDILIKIDASNESVQEYLCSIESSLLIIEEKLQSVENTN